MAKKTEKIDKNSEFIKRLNTNFGRKIAGLLKDSENANIKDFVSTGSTVLDVFVSNVPKGGWPCGRINVVEGESSTGKSLIAAHSAADTLKRGGTVIYIDNEHAVDMNFFRRIGVDVSKMIYVDGINYLEEVFELIEKSAIEFRNENPDELFTVILDSVSSTPTKAESEGDYEAKYMGEVARVLSQNCKKIIKTLIKYKVCLIITNQLRTKIPRPGEHIYGDALIGTGGKALSFYATTLVMLKKAGEIKDKGGKDGEVIGSFVNAKVLKTRFGPSARRFDLNVYFSHGIDDAGSWLEVLKKFGVVTVSGAWCSSKELYGDEKFQTSDWNKSIKDPVFKEKTREILERVLVKNYDELDTEKSVIEGYDLNSAEEAKILASQLNIDDSEFVKKVFETVEEKE